MPGIDFGEVRARIALANVLDLLGFVPSKSSGDQVRGPCPVHRSDSTLSRSFSANLKLHIYICFKCGSYGNQLDLYAAATGLGLFAATVAHFVSGDTNSDPLRPVLIPTPIMLPCYRFLPPFSGPFSVFTSGSGRFFSRSTSVNLDRINPLLRFSRNR